MLRNFECQQTRRLRSGIAALWRCLTDLDLEERRDLPIHKLSGGQLKRVSIGWSC